ncbi:AAA family ATPase [Methylacidiphilum caldifontis]|uniref:AAA domain-containing protein n=1 Tax=Methylacidiphilum caldifontis TaxID=2795386 RepID=UPI001A8CD6B5|nr:AAA domain-containing protein [Methylacidiphilum caldifontis]QSR89289.1 AAA family ATPase [Methylacidiphilum caldifontis]
MSFKNSHAFSQKNKAIALLRYLAELHKIIHSKRKLPRNLLDYGQDSVFFLEDLRRFKEVQGLLLDAPLADNEERTEHLLSFLRPEVPRRPDPPKNLRDWIDWIENKELNEDLDDVQKPKLKEQIKINGKILEPNPSLLESYNRFVEQDWKAWLDKYKKYQDVSREYRKLFKIYQQIKQEEEKYELLYCIGLLVWAPKDRQKIRHPILGFPLGIEYKEDTGEIQLFSDPDRIGAEVQTTFLDPDEKPNNLRELEEEAKKLASPLEKEKIVELLKRFIHVLDPHGKFCPDRLPREQSDFSSYPQVYWEPIILFRNRITEIFSQRVDEAIQEIERLEKPPLLFSYLCGLSSSIDEQTLPTEDKRLRETWDDIFFPLLSNEEQRDIVLKLEKQPAVVVQGPPGTGKSHTIANLICHLLAHGKKVLVTSQTSRALKVLYDKLPDSLKPLCVTALGDRKEDMDRMEKSVNGILDMQSRVTTEVLQRNIELLSKYLKETREQLRMCNDALRTYRATESTSIHIPGTYYQGTPGELVLRLRQEEKELGWICDPVNPDYQYPTIVEELVHAYWTLHEISSDRKEELKLLYPSIKELPLPQDLEELWRKENLLQQEINQLGLREIEYNSLLTIDKEILKERSDAAKALFQEFSLKGSRSDWLKKALEEILLGYRSSWQELEGRSAGLIAEIEQAKEAREIIVDGLTQPLPLALKQAQTLLSHLESGGGWGFLIFQPKVVRQTRALWAFVKVNGHPCRDRKTLSNLLVWLRCQMCFEELSSLWETHLGKISSFSLPERMAIFTRNQQLLRELLCAELEVRQLENWLASQLDSPISIKSLPELRKASDLLSAAWIAKELQNIHNKLEQIKRILARIDRASAHPITNDLWETLKEKDIQRYWLLYEKLREMENDRVKLEFASQVIGKWKQVLPNTMEKLLSTIADPEWPKRLESLPKAWKWAIARTYIEKLLKEKLPVEEYQKRKKELEIKEKKLIEDLAASRARFFLRKVMPEEGNGNLTAWKKTLRKIGKGTGKYVSFYQKEASQYLGKCRNVVPAWVLPFNRLLQTLHVKPEFFDVIIIDEASQSELDSLLLCFIAKKAVIVGDDEQISPEAVGIDKKQVRSLINQYLKDHPFASLFEGDSSLFDIAETMFSQRIRLREHFRCMPEIIAFSNKISYTNYPLYPLRTYGLDRLEPLKAVYVENGYRDEKGSQIVNPPEAQKVVETVMKCLEDSRYENRTMGIISLQGEKQAELINKLLLDSRIPVERMNRHRIVCGDPYTFQGDERDVIFLSIVAAPPKERIGALTKPSDRRRFNVAASRARDQLWLFYSVSLEDLSPNCMRSFLLKHFLEDPRVPVPEGGVPDWSICESEFERKVAKLIWGKGYNLRLQEAPFGPGGYRIDIVVIGHHARLAVECDGPHHTELEQQARDWERQATLERYGWEFWRLPLSRFEWEGEKALDPLWDRLKEKGILPSR